MRSCQEESRVAIQEPHIMGDADRVTGDIARAQFIPHPTSTDQLFRGTHAFEFQIAHYIN